jgi:hypothetical protein
MNYRADCNVTNLTGTMFIKQSFRTVIEIGNVMEQLLNAFGKPDIIDPAQMYETFLGAPPSPRLCFCG